MVIFKISIVKGITPSHTISWGKQLTVNNQMPSKRLTYIYKYCLIYLNISSTSLKVHNYCCGA